MTPFASRGLSTLVATGGWHSSSGLPTGGVTSQENTAPRSAEDPGANPGEDCLGFRAEAASSHEPAPSAGTACMKLRRVILGIRKTSSLLDAGAISGRGVHP